MISNSIKYVFLLILLSFAGTAACSDQPPIQSIETGYTILKVRTVAGANGDYILASSYEGTLLGVSFDGEILWKNRLSGYMNHDLWAGDLNADGVDEVFAANADGSIYALNSEGQLLWSFKQNDAPMNAVTLIRTDESRYVVAGGYDRNIYYLDTAGKVVKSIPSSHYSMETVRRKSEKPLPRAKEHTINFLRPVPQGNGTDRLAVNATNNSMQSPGHTYLFDPLSSTPIAAYPVAHRRPAGDFRVVDTDSDGDYEILTGNSTALKDSAVSVLKMPSGQQGSFKLADLPKKAVGFGYRVAQAEMISDGEERKLLILFGDRIVLMDSVSAPGKVDLLSSRYAYNDLWKDSGSGRIVLASAQSGGSAIHIVDPQHPDWKSAYQNLNPPGKIRAILQNTDTVRSNLKRFKRPQWERQPLPVYFLSENQKTKFVRNKVKQLRKDYPGSPVFLNYLSTSETEKWDRSVFGNEVYENKRDRRRSYELTQKEVLDKRRKLYRADSPGGAYWGGHGNDPLFSSLETNKKSFDLANGKKTVMIFPELEQSNDDFIYAMENFIYPLAEHGQKTNGHIYVRTKHTFWQAYVHLPVWSRLESGEFADVFIPSMEETTDKSMELSVAGRMGIWAAGSVNQWGSRAARDNPSFDRTRQHSHQMLPNHFLRQMVYHISSGATEINNFPVDQEYMSLLWDLIAKGALYVPKASELLHLSPVHLSIISPDSRYLNDGHNVKWTSFFDAKEEAKNPMVFGRLNGSWPGAANTEWDFSRYAAGVKDRRQNFLPPYENGMVLITPPQAGAESKPRGLLRDRLHPFYKNKLQEILTDGRNYYSADSSQSFQADKYFETVANNIHEKAQELPLTVTGGVAWTVAQTSPTHLRLTLIDSGYLNPNERTALVTFHAVNPKKVRDVLDGENFDVSVSKQVRIDVPLGAFRFIDVQLDKPL